MRIPKTGRPKWATHYMYQFDQRGVGGYWIGDLKIQKVDSDGKSEGDVGEVERSTFKEYLAGWYILTVKRLAPLVLENK